MKKRKLGRHQVAIMFETFVWVGGQVTVSRGLANNLPKPIAAYGISDAGVLFKFDNPNLAQVFAQLMVQYTTTRVNNSPLLVRRI